MQNIQSKLIITVKNYINITSFKMKGSPDHGQAVSEILSRSNMAVKNYGADWDFSCAHCLVIVILEKCLCHDHDTPLIYG